MLVSIVKWVVHASHAVRENPLIKGQRNVTSTASSLSVDLAKVENESGTCTCPYPQACDGCGCSDGYIGELCQTCAPGFFADNNECIQCPDNIPIVVASLLVSILILGILLYFLTKRLINYSGFASIMIAHSQILQIIIMHIKLNTSHSLLGIVRGLIQ